MKHTVRPSVNVYILSQAQDKVLLSRRKNTGWKDGWLCAPGGHIESGESPLGAMVREIQEELGCVVKAESLEFLCVAARKDAAAEYVAYEFLLKDAERYTFTNAEPDKCSELAWVDIHNLPEEVIADFRQIIEQSIVGNKKYLEIGFSHA